MPTPRPTDPPARSLNRQHVLDEDEYTEALSHIIARDFFPSLVHLDATNDYLDSLRTQDPALIAASVRRLETLATPTTQQRAPLQTPSQTPYGGGPSDTPRDPGETPRGAGGQAPAKRPRYDGGLGLDAFQACYTSEDNASFTEILDDENRARRERWAWAWAAQKRVEEQRERMLEGREKMMIETPPTAGVRERRVIELPVPKGLITADEQRADGGEEGNETESKGKEVAVVPHEGGGEQGEVDVMAPRKDTRSAGVDGWKFKARNSLMFSPDADISPYDAPEPSSSDLSLPPKVVKHDNTRLPEQDDRPSRGVSAPPSPTRSRIDAAIAGTPYRPRSPTIHNFSLVPAMPSPTPSELGPAAVKQLMTWGTLNATPRVLSRDEDMDPAAAATPAAPFHLPAPSSREKLSHRLSERASKSLRERADRITGGTPRVAGSKAGKSAMAPPAWTPRRADAAGALTPAARRLLDRSSLGTAAIRRAEAMDRAAAWEGAKAEKDLNRVRWTPTPSPVTRRDG